MCDTQAGINIWATTHVGCQKKPSLCLGFLWINENLLIIFSATVYFQRCLGSEDTSYARSYYSETWGLRQLSAR